MYFIDEYCIHNLRSHFSLLTKELNFTVVNGTVSVVVTPCLKDRYFVLVFYIFSLSA